MSQTAVRKSFRSGELKLSYLDFGGESDRILLLLHGHMGNARTFSELAVRFPDWRVIALDQRGHGWSDHAPGKDYSRESYLADLRNLIEDELGGKPVAILGHSLGGVNAYQFAARYPERVRAAIIEDIGAVIRTDMSFAERLPERSASLKELRDALRREGLRAIDYFAECVFEDERGWGFQSDRSGIVVSNRNCQGEWWADWLGSSCPMLLAYGEKSFAIGREHAEEMAKRRPNTRLAAFDCGHGIHTDRLDDFAAAVRTFLDEL